MERMSDPGVVDSRLHPCLSAGDSRWEDVLEEAVNLYSPAVDYIFWDSLFLYIIFLL